MLSSNAKYIVDAVNLISTSEEISIKESFDRLLEHCASVLDIDSKVCSRFKVDTHVKLHSSFNLDRLTKDIGDWFGEAYVHLGLLSDQALLTDDECNLRIAGVQSNPNQFPQVVLCKRMQSGRILLNLFKAHNMNLLLYGLEPDATLYRIALINSMLYRIPAILLCVEDSSIDTKDFNSSSSNWEFANQWTTPGAKWIK